jgi:hypothetical protein
MKGGIMMRINESASCLDDREMSVIPGGVADLTAIKRRLAPSVERAAPRQRAMA